jgi:hypothetical protein
MNAVTPPLTAAPLTRTCGTFLHTIPGQKYGATMTDATTVKPEPEGLGGWLILPIIGTLGSPIFMAFTIFQTLVTVVPVYSQIGSGLQVFLAVETIANVTMVGGWVYAVVLLFQKKRMYPTLFITMLLTTLAVTVVDALVGFTVFDIPFETDDVRAISRGVIGGAIWIPYMRMSRRVRNTFVN